MASENIKSVSKIVTIGQESFFLVKANSLLPESTEIARIEILVKEPGSSPAGGCLGETSSCGGRWD